MWIYFWVFNSIPLINLSVSKPIMCIFYYYCSVVYLDIRDVDTSRLIFIVKDCFSYLGFFVFPYEVENCSFKVCEELCWEFWWELHWVSRWLLVRRLFPLLILWLMSMRDLSIFWNLKFLSSVTWRFYHSSLSLSWLELHQDILHYLKPW